MVSLTTISNVAVRQIHITVTYMVAVLFGGVDEFMAE
jgi:hypothetical protein